LTHVNFTNRKLNRVLVEINSQKIPYANIVKYLDMTFDVKLDRKNTSSRK